MSTRSIIEVDRESYRQRVVMALAEAARGLETEFEDEPRDPIIRLSSINYADHRKMPAHMAEELLLLIRVFNAGGAAITFTYAKKLRTRHLAQLRKLKKGLVLK